MTNDELQRARGFTARLEKALNDAGFPPKNYGRQARVAEQMGVTISAVNRWLTGKGFPDQKYFEKLARLLDVRMEWLFFGLGSDASASRDSLPLDGSDIAEPPQRLTAARNYGVDYSLLKTIVTTLRHVHQQYPLGDLQYAALLTELYDAIHRHSTPDPTDQEP